MNGVCWSKCCCAQHVCRLVGGGRHLHVVVLVGDAHQLAGLEIAGHDFVDQVPHQEGLAYASGAGNDQLLLVAKKELEEACKAAGIDISIERDGKKVDFNDFKLSDIENLINKTQGLVDENNNTSQMDQLQLQSLISKRNAQFEMASTVIKKIIDSLSAIIANMR